MLYEPKRNLNVRMTKMQEGEWIQQEWGLEKKQGLAGLSPQGLQQRTKMSSCDGPWIHEGRSLHCSRKGQEFPPPLPTAQSCGSQLQAALPLLSPVVSSWYRITELDGTRGDHLLLKISKDHGSATFFVTHSLFHPFLFPFCPCLPPPKETQLPDRS